ncbi:MAG: hypothetical protein ACK5FX_07190 [Flavobacteriia bacterium]
MYFTPIVIKTYQIKKGKNEFLKALRADSREPFFDNKNARRLDNDDKKILASEFDNYIFLKNEVVGYRWNTNKTLIHLSENNSGLRILTISFPGGVGGLFYVGFGLLFTLFFGIKIFLSEGKINYLFFFIVLYVITIININSDFKEQNDFVKNTIDKLNNNNKIQ